MAKATQFDLSRLEGCTGTLSQHGVAVPHTLLPARERRAAPQREPAGHDRDARPNPEPESTPITRHPAGAESIGRAPADEELAPTATAVAQSRTPPAPAPVASAAPEIEPAQSAVTASTCAAVAAREACDELPIAIILALTLSVWIPVLLLWTTRLG